MQTHSARQFSLIFLSGWRKGRVSVKAGASENRVHEGLPFGAGLGWRKAQRWGFGDGKVPNKEEAAEPLPSSRVSVSACSSKQIKIC
jgi:hypothetical protein